MMKLAQVNLIGSSPFWNCKPARRAGHTRKTTWIRAHRGAGTPRFHSFAQSRTMIPWRGHLHLTGLGLWSCGSTLEVELIFVVNLCLTASRRTTCVARDKKAPWCGGVVVRWCGPSLLAAWLVFKNLWKSGPTGDLNRFPSPMTVNRLKDLVVGARQQTGPKDDDTCVQLVLDTTRIQSGRGCFAMAGMAHVFWAGRVRRPTGVAGCYLLGCGFAVDWKTDERGCIWSVIRPYIFPSSYFDQWMLSDESRYRSPFKNRLWSDSDVNHDSNGYETHL